MAAEAHGAASRRAGASSAASAQPAVHMAPETRAKGLISDTWSRSSVAPALTLRWSLPP